MVKKEMGANASLSRIAWTGILAASLAAIDVASAQTFGGKPLATIDPFAVSTMAPIKLHRVIDKENHVVCYMLSDGKTAPSCVSLR